MDAPKDLAILLERARIGTDGLEALQDHVFIRELGQGGMGTVSLIRDRRNQEQVAIKLIHPELMANPEIKKRFLREMQNSAILKHPNIIRLRDAVETGDSAFFTMEYCDGGSVESLVEQRGGPLSVKQSLHIILQCLDGLEYAHRMEMPNPHLPDGNAQHGGMLVHRDLKPANLLLSGSHESPMAKIGDFGLAKMRSLAGLSNITRTASGAWGTPAFMSREQALNFKYSGPEVDVWSIAATLYYMLTTEVPRDFGGNLDGFAVVKYREAIPILERRRDLPHQLAAVIDAALLETTKLKFQSAATLKVALEDVL